MGEYSYFYIWTRRKTGKQYVGVTTRPIDQRFREHCSEDSGCTKLRNAIQKHGVGAFDFEYFEWVDPWDLAYIEKILVDELESLSPNGYNLKEGGGNYGSLSEEVKKKLSDAHTGKTHTEETKKQMSEAHIGKTFTEASKKKMSEAKSGPNNPMFGKTHTEDAKKKLSDANIGKTHTEATKKKLSEAVSGEKNPMYGKTFTEDAKKKLSEALSKKVYQYAMDGTFIRPFVSVTEATGHLGKSTHSAISGCARGERKSAYKFKWSYEEKEFL
ncbi:GIY-YIG catalytic containing endonuclease [Only Syngen Nebraska virus 5]|uniref:GIY-YIG catalytic containing endonuclease n=1 Tax=Only Syngen Nebraska virus 5 TaxID=1917232 RepID=UPI000901B575|nr:GIY-YIG catalytic containing endonuclease [Only Syngen Nebraska virus 5]APC25804.1 GIY-YIG catalytic containing endonuclease [Only Syngen Nebraska virus 5]